MNELGYIEVRCPHCGRRVYFNISDDKNTDSFKVKKICGCDKVFNFEYDIILGKVIISADMYLKSDN